MFQDQRREKILQLLQENGSCRVQELKKLFNVSEPTIRQDLESLEKTGTVTRQHGGAFINSLSNNTQIFSLPNRGHEEQKAKIGLKAAELVQNGDSLILDSGTTVSEMVGHIKSCKNLNIVTNALNIALQLGMEPTNNVLVVGGVFKPPTLSLTGEKGLSLFENLYVEKLFLATGGFSLEAGLTYPAFSDIALKRAMIASAKTVYLLADSSKLEKVLFASLGCTDTIDFILTDEGITPEYVKKLEAAGIHVIICK
ncbi:DeoR/GlpR family DNA-binding transcription regulator [uncultured Sphaerochaeta sp.]|uniref:DeoR/GlpR family DNA-binding transcription regulator n=1 Tax=uncultured Sphaerochaeta sp. TaxID=886478 RepID=UPI002A0A88D1|nr:DeoR/GlpR family DNA-binding transcription regulator [uncultured Sphaerochaeta sp.]